MSIKHLVRFAAISLALCLPTLPDAAQADSSSISINITANVDIFCQISPPASDRIDLVEGTGVIGEVREICNTPSGYTVTTNFTNLAEGTLEAAGESLPVDASGQAVRTSTQAAVKTSSWRLADATPIQPTSPVFMRVTITPR